MSSLIVAAVLGQAAMMPPPPALSRSPIVLARASCKSCKSYRDAVVAWCAGRHPA